MAESNAVVEVPNMVDEEEDKEEGEKLEGFESAIAAIDSGAASDGTSLNSNTSAKEEEVLLLPSTTGLDSSSSVDISATTTTATMAKHSRSSSTIGNIQQLNTLSNDTATFDKIILPRRPCASRTNASTTTTSSSFCGLIVVKDHVYSLDEDVAQIDQLLKRVAKGAILTWICLIALSYWVVPSGCIQRYTGTERNALLVELAILTTAVFVKHLPLVWEMNLRDLTTPSISSSSSFKQQGLGRRGNNNSNNKKTNFNKTLRRTGISGVLAGGMAAQFIAIMSVTIMVCFPVPVVIDPVLGSRVHLIRWCEWTPCAGFLTLMMDCVDAPQYDGTKFTHPWKTVFSVAAMESLSTSCGLIFPFCTNVYVWMTVLVFACVTFLSVPIRYVQKRRLFQNIRWRGGRRVDEIELYERTRTSLALNFVCSGVWSLMVIAYFVTSCGHLVVSESWTLMHDPAITMLGNCVLDLLSKCLYMALILDAHHAIFDESKRANRRLAELRNMMGVVWENSSDTIAISVKKISGNVTSMVSPSFFRSALSTAEQMQIQDISAVILEHSHVVMNSKRDPSANKEFLTKDNTLSSDVGIEIIRKQDFNSVDFHFYGDNVAYEYSDHENGDMTQLVNAFTDMLVRAWQDESEEVLFEYDTSAKEDGKKQIKYEVMLTRLDENAKVLVVRNVSERFQRFEAEKRFIFETTARQRDAEANRFTRHEVKNGILAAIEICGNVHDHISNDVDRMRARQIISDASLSFGIESVVELDHTLHEVLDIIQAGTMARDIINGIYVPRMEHIDLNFILGQIRGYKVNSSHLSFASTPSPLPILLSDSGLLKCIHGNAIRNSLKYGKVGGDIKTEATYDQNTGTFEMKIINLPGLGHEKLVAMGSRASELVFSHGTRLHAHYNMGKRGYSAGDGAWIIRKCATILGGEVGITFERERTVFWFQAPIKLGTPIPHDVDDFRLPSDVWGIGIDDSTIQRKLLRVLFEHAGIPESRQVIIGKNTEEIVGFVNFVVDFVNSHPTGRFFIVADENFEIADSSIHEQISGSECIQLIRKSLTPEQEMRVLALVRSANDSPQDLASFNLKAHGVMPKAPMRGTSVRETVYRFWRQRFSDEEGEISIPPFSSIDDIIGTTSVSKAELLAELEKIDHSCVGNTHNVGQLQVLWDMLNKLKGDLKSVNVEDRLTKSIDVIDTLRDGDKPAADFMLKWLQIRSDVVSFISK